MLTDMKTRNDVTRYFCRLANYEDSIDDSLQPGSFDQQDSTAWCRSALTACAKKRAVLDIPARGDCPTEIDVATLIKAARLQIDRHPSWLREAGPVQRETSCPNAATFQLGTFIGGLAHHFNNLFMVVQGNLSLMRMPGSGVRRHHQRLQRMEKLIQCESMLTNDLLGPTVDPRYRCNVALQTRILGEIVLIAEQIRPTGKNMCVFPIPLDADFMRIFLPRLAGSVATLLDRLITELNYHCRLLMADLSFHSNDYKRLQAMVTELYRGALWTAKLCEYAGTERDGDVSIGKLKLVEIVLEIWSRKDRRVPINLSCKSEFPEVAADRDAVGRILEELFENAESHSRDDAAVTVEIQNAENGVQITVANTGTGSDENIGDYMFLPFFSTRTNAGRCGLGLASAEGIVRSLGGAISMKPGAGNEIAVMCWLPSSQMKRAETKDVS